jgi:hypothetical protein
MSVGLLPGNAGSQKSAIYTYQSVVDTGKTIPGGSAQYNYGISPISTHCKFDNIALITSAYHFQTTNRYLYNCSNDTMTQIVESFPTGFGSSSSASGNFYALDNVGMHIAVNASALCNINHNNSGGVIL